MVLKRTFEPRFCEGGTTFEKDNQLLFEGCGDGLERLDIDPREGFSIQDNIARLLNPPEKKLKADIHCFVHVVKQAIAPHEVEGFTASEHMRCKRFFEGGEFDFAFPK